MKDNPLLQRIETNPKIMAGKPVIRGTRLTVEHILSRLGHGVSFEQLVGEYPGVSQDDLCACFLFASH